MATTETFADANIMMLRLAKNILANVPVTGGSVKASLVGQWAETLAKLVIALHPDFDHEDPVILAQLHADANAYLDSGEWR